MDRRETFDLMAQRRKASTVALTRHQRERLERLWFVYGNYGPKTTPGNHQFIQGLLEHNLDLRPLQTKRTAKRDRPTEECERAVDAVLASNADDEGKAGRLFKLRLVPSPDGERKPAPPDHDLRELLADMRRRYRGQRERETRMPGGGDAA